MKDKQIISNKIYKMLELLSDNLKRNNIPYSLIGAVVLGYYGQPRYTNDMDFLVKYEHKQQIMSIMEKLGYQCYQQNELFAKFDSQLGVFGNVDFMFVSTADGKKIIEKSIVIKDELFGENPIIQPSDYIILKLMAIANDPSRMANDKADIVTFLRLYNNDLIPSGFDKLDMDRIYKFADRFDQKYTFDDLIEQTTTDGKNDHFL